MFLASMDEAVAASRSVASNLAATNRPSGVTCEWERMCARGWADITVWIELREGVSRREGALGTDARTGPMWLIGPRIESATHPRCLTLRYGWATRASLHEAFAARF